jgi:peptidoglycan hydrolase-like protein with peptidoglycan-binding domain
MKLALKSNKNKMNRKNLLQLTFALILFNLILASVAVYNFYSSKVDLNKIAKSTDSVLGVNSNTPTFDPNFIISDQTFSSTRVFDTEAKVQDYLNNVNSPLKNYTEQGRRASYYIFAAARGQTSSKWGVVPNLNPGLILAYLEKEQSLLSLSGYDTNADPERRIRTAMGYGCPDTSVCATEYFGFANQVNWAAYQLQFNFNLSITRSSMVAPYHVNNTITTLDEYNIFLTNAATAANYRYTPHVYWGNYNLWAIIVANGWGIDTNTYTKADLDAKNLVGKDIQVNVNAGDQISLEQVKDIIQLQYSLGQNNDNIKLLQRFLRQQGYYLNREITGMYGVITDQALKNYIRDKKLGVSAADNQARCNALINTNYNIGDVSDDIKTLQECLRNLGLFNWPSNTGYFGPITTEAQKLARGKAGNVVTANNSPDNSCSALKAASYSDGEISDRVKLLQGCLRADGLFTHPSDTGYFGPVTLASLNRWRSQNSAPPVQSSTPAKPAEASGCESFKQKTYKIGDTGTEIVDLQKCLRTEGLFTWPSDTGYFGPVTLEAFSRLKGNSTPVFLCENLKGQVWNFGEQSNRVKQLQDCMKTAGKFNFAGGSTGYFGEVTKASIIAWRGYL